MAVPTARRPRSLSTRTPRSGYRFPFFLPFQTNVPFPIDDVYHGTTGYRLHASPSNNGIKRNNSEDTTEDLEACCREPSIELRTFHRRKKQRVPESSMNSERRTVEESFLDSLDCDVPRSSSSCEKRQAATSPNHCDLLLSSDSYDDKGEISQLDTIHYSDPKRSVKRIFTMDQQKHRGLKNLQNKVIAVTNRKSLSARIDVRDANFHQEKYFSQTACSVKRFPSLPEKTQQHADESEDVTKNFTRRKKSADLFSNESKSAHMNQSKNSQLHAVRKSKRVPKKRTFDDNIDGASNARKMPEKKCENIFEDDCFKGDEANDSRSDHSRKSDTVEREHSVSPEQCTTEFSEGSCNPDHTSLPLPNVSLSCLLKKSKEGISDPDLAIKKEEAAKRRKQESENNAKRTQANAIQKILGQESSRKKREDKILKQRQEIEQEKQAALMAPPVNSIRWTMGPSGNIVSFSEDVELSRIFPGSRSYPQEREKCAGPFCKNAYKYRDSKTQLPLCSLQCYKAVQKLPNLTPAF